VPRPSWVLNSFTVSRRAAVALARRRPQGKQIWRFRLGPRFRGAAQGKPAGVGRSLAVASHSVPALRKLYIALRGPARPCDLSSHWAQAM